MKTNMIIAFVMAVVCVGAVGAYMVMNDSSGNEDSSELAIYYDDEKVNGSTISLTASKAPSVASLVTVKLDGTVVTSSSTFSGIPSTATAGNSFTVTVTYGSHSAKFTVSVTESSLDVYYGGSKINGTSLDLTVVSAPSLASSLTVKFDGTDVTSSATVSGIPDSFVGGESFTVTVTYGSYSVQFSASVEEPAGLEAYYGGVKVNDTTLTLTTTDVSSLASSLTVLMDGTDVTSSATVSGIPSTVSSGDSFTVTVAYGSKTVQFAVSVVSYTFTITYVSGTENCYTVTSSDGEYTITFSGMTEKSEYSISGILNGNIVIDAGDYKFVLDLDGVTITSSLNSAIVAESGDSLTISAKKGTENTVTDNRSAVSDSDTQYSACIYSVCDLDLQGKGTLKVVSENNNGIHTKDDLNVKNLTLYVECQDNALKGNDSVTIESGTITLIAKTGDGIKTTNSSTTYNTDGSLKKQKGNVTIDSDEGNVILKIYAACDGIDAAYDVSVSETEGNSVSVSIYTASYSGYSEEVSADSEIYLLFTSKSYYYSVLFTNGTNTVWETPEYYGTATSGGRGTTYYAYTVDVPSGYSKFTVYAYTSSSSQGSTSGYTAVSDSITVNTSYNACLLTISGTSMTSSWKNLQTSSSSSPGGMPGGTQEGNQDTLDYSAKGIKAADAIAISGGTFVIQAYDDALHANSDTAVEATTSSGSTVGYGSGNITISGGTFTITTKDDGIHADGTLTVSAGTITVTTCYEGLEGAYIVVSGGSISVKSSDDGFNSTATAGTGITVSGGYIYVYAGGDGLDANSKTSYAGFKISGGYIVSICTSSGNSALDTENGYVYTGGYVVAFNPSTGGMSSESTNCSNFSSVGKSTSVSGGSGTYVKVTGNGETCVVKLPSNLQGLVTLGFTSSPTVTTSSSASASVDSNGVYWS